MTLLQGIHHIGELADFNTTYMSQLVNIYGKLRSVNVHSLVRTPCRNHHGVVVSLMLGILNVVVQVIYRIIGGADTLYVVMLHQSTSRELGLLQLLVTLIENLTSGLGRQNLIDTESGLQLQVCPVIQGVTQGVGNGLCPLLKLLPVCSVLTGAEALVYAIGTHGTPLIVVTTQPQLCDALKLMVVSNHLRNQVTVIVNDRHLSRMVVIQVLCYLIVEHEVFVVKLLNHIMFFVLEILFNWMQR